MDVNVQDDIKKEVVVAYNEVLRKLKGKKNEEKTPDQIVEEEKHAKAVEEEQRVVEKASRQTPDDLVRHLGELKLFVSKSLDDIKQKLLPEFEKFLMIDRAIKYKEGHLATVNEIEVNIHSLEALLIAQKEQAAAFTREMNARRNEFEHEKALAHKLWQQEEKEYVQKRDASRKLDQEQYDILHRELQQELSMKRSAFEEEFSTREARLVARENELQQLKDREARNVAREQEYQQLQEKVVRFPEDLNNAVQKERAAIMEQLSRKYEYDAKLMKIELDGERKMYQQKIDALEQQIEQYKSLKQLFQTT